MKTIEISIPEELMDLFGSEEELKEKSKQAFALDLVRRGKISKGKAAELLGKNLWDLPQLLVEYQMPWFTYSEEELEEDLRTLRELEKSRKDS